MRAGIGETESAPPTTDFWAGRSTTVPVLVWKWNEGRREAAILGFCARACECAWVQGSPERLCVAEEIFGVLG